MPLRVDHGVASGTFSLDGQTFEVDNNIWVVGDDEQCVVIDAPHSVPAILDVVAGRRVTAIILTHAHDDHVRVAPELAEATGAPLHDNQQIGVLTVLHTPGHSPGAVCLYAPDLGCVFTGDTLFHGGPGATGRSFSDYDTIVRSIRERLFTLPTATIVHTGHGNDTLIAAERI